MEKKCTQCKVMRDISHFIGKANRECVTCDKCRDRSKKSNTKRRTQQIEYNRKWRKENNERVKLYNECSRNDKDWKQIKKENGISDHEPKISPHRKKHVIIDNIECKSCSKCKEWKPINRYGSSSFQWDNLRVTCWDCHNKYQADRLKTDPYYKLSRRLRSRMTEAIKNQNGVKSGKSFDLIGCTIEYVRGWLEAKFQEGMTWENYGEWHVDHIKPCSKFDLTKEEDQRKCFHYTNLQPLWAYDNLSKGNKYVENDEC